METLVRILMLGCIVVFQACGTRPSFTAVSTTNQKSSNAEAGPGPVGKVTSVVTKKLDAKKDDTEAQEHQKLLRLPKVGMLVNDLECGLCHVSVIGDVASTRDVSPPRSDSETHIIGRWLAADDFLAGNWVNADGGIQTNYVGKEMPLDTNNDGHADFPEINFSQISGNMRGQIDTNGPYAMSVSKSFASHAIFIGTATDPIRISGDIFVDGDVVIKGFYTGNGTIYATGNVYVPGDLKALRTAFPFPDDPNDALLKANQLVADKNTDSLGIATAKSVLIGDLESSVYTYGTVPINRQAAALEVYKVYDWFPGGKSAYETLYENLTNCYGGGSYAVINMVEAFLYARKAVAGITRGSSYTIRGGVIADYMHVLSGAANCPSTISPVHGRPQNRSYIEYDYRMQTGYLKILEQLVESFPAAE